MIPIDLTPLEGIFLTAIEEDLGAGDVTSLAVVPEGARALGEYIAKEPLVVCGLSVAEEIVRICDGGVKFQTNSSDGAQVEQGTVLATIGGSARSILAAERTSLNFLQRLSGIATRTREYVAAIAGTQSFTRAATCARGRRARSSTTPWCGRPISPRRFAATSSTTTTPRSRRRGGRPGDERSTPRACPERSVRPSGPTLTLPARAGFDPAGLSGRSGSLLESASSLSRFLLHSPHAWASPRPDPGAGNHRVRPAHDLHRQLASRRAGVAQ